LNQLAEDFTGLILEDQDCFGTDTGCETLLSLIPDEKVTTELSKKWKRDSMLPSTEKWDDFKKQIKSIPKGTQQRVRLY
jgi:DNA primase small subunit